MRAARPKSGRRSACLLQARLSPRCGNQRRRYSIRNGPSGSLRGPTSHRDTARYFPADFGSATIMSSSMRAPGDESWLMHTVVLAGSQSPK